ncbi:MAG: transcription termination factor NusA [Candidatus Pacebacteria bacterium]|nr:transcription termination factor NusA [Candidatus Paceibacterota bacterium]
MFDLKNFTSAISQIAEEKGISYEKVVESIESAIAAAYKKDYGEKGQIIKAKLDPQSGEVKFWQVKLAVNKDMIYSEKELEELKEKSLQAENEKQEGEKEGEKKVRFNPERHIMLEDAKKIDPKIKTGEELETLLETKADYGRIAAQTAKQVILQKIREAERETILSEYKSKEGELISGIVQRIEGRNIFFDIGKTLGVLTREEQIPGEFYRPGQRLKVYILKVEESPKGPLVFLSRAYPKLISKLFELEVPEVSSGSVVIKSIAREAGSRSKIAVASTVEGVDPIGSMVGQRGTRVMAVINELGGEKIDIIEWSDDPQRFIANSLSPAKAVEVKILPKNKALVIIPDDQLSLAIGKEGQNVRLAAKLTGWKIDVRSPGQVESEAAEANEVDKASKADEEKEEIKEAKDDKEIKKEEKTKEKPASKKKNSKTKLKNKK